MTLKLPRLTATTAVTDKDTGKAISVFTRFWDAFATQIESGVNGLAQAVADIAAAQATADTAIANAATAQTTANNAATAAAAAQTAVTAISSQSLVAESYVTGCTIAGHDDGTDCSINIGGHTRVYGDGTSVSVTGGSVSGVPYTSDCWVYYDDAGRTGGAVTYHQTGLYGSASPSTANPSRHFVGAITVPANGAPDTNGNPADHPGYVGP